MIEWRKRFGAIAIAALAALAVNMAAPSQAQAEEEDQCWYSTFSYENGQYHMVCMTVENYIIGVAIHTCGEACTKKAQKTYDMFNNKPVTPRLLRQYRAMHPGSRLGEPPGMTNAGQSRPIVRNGSKVGGNRPISAGNKLPSGGNKLSQGSKTPSAPLTAASTSATGANANTSLVKKH